MVAVVAGALFATSISLDTLPNLVENSQTLIGGAVVGQYAAVEPNQYNTLVSQISEKEQELAAREQELNEIEARLRSSRFLGFLSFDVSTYSFITSIVLFLLLLLNFAWDFRRSYRKLPPSSEGRPAQKSFQVMIKK